MTEWQAPRGERLWLVSCYHLCFCKGKGDDQKQRWGMVRAGTCWLVGIWDTNRWAALCLLWYWCPSSRLLSPLIHRVLGLMPRKQYFQGVTILEDKHDTEIRSWSCTLESASIKPKRSARGRQMFLEFESVEWLISSGEGLGSGFRGETADRERAVKS